MKYRMTLTLLLLFNCAFSEISKTSSGLPLYYWDEIFHGRVFENFGDILSFQLVERIVDGPLRRYIKGQRPIEKKILAAGSLLYFALDGDVLWGTGCNLKRTDFRFKTLDVRAVRGPRTRKLLTETLGVDCPEIYGDPALLFPYFFPEFKKKTNPSRDFLIIVHYEDEHLFPKEEWENVVYSTDPWQEIVEKIIDSRFVISTALHGVIIAEAYQIPARLLVLSKREPLFKYFDYYEGTNRPDFHYATSIDEAFELGGEPPFNCDLKKLYEAFPFDYWPNVTPRSSAELGLDRISN